MSHAAPEHESDLFNQAARFAARAHQGATVPGTELPYLLHVVQVCHEALGAAAADPTLDRRLILACALLHDTVEDTDTTVEQLAETFGEAVAAGVSALSKRDHIDGVALTKAEKMADSLSRIRAQPREVWCVKLADRITNLQPPPAHWMADKIRSYQEEARIILEHLGEASPVLAARLAGKIEGYGGYAVGR